MKHRRPQLGQLWLAVCAAWVALHTSACRCVTDSSRPAVSAAAPGGGADRGAGGILWQRPREVARGPAHAGPWRMNDSKFHYVDDPTPALHADGSLALAWVDNQRQDVFFRRFDSGGQALWGPTNVSRSPQRFSWLPRVELDPDDPGLVFVLWQEIVFSGGSHGGDAFFARSQDGGRTFQAPLNLSSSRAGDGKGRFTSERWHNGSLALLRAAPGTLLAAWTSYEGALWVSRSSDHGASFSTPVHVGGSDELPARAPALATAASGEVHLAWAVGEDSHGDLRHARSRDAGASFSEPEVILASDGYSDAPSLATDAGGRLHLVYDERPTGMFGRSHVRYAHSDSGRFSSSRPLTDPDSGAAAGFPAIATAGELVFVLWEHFPDPDQRARGLGFSWSSDRGLNFHEATLVPGSEADLGVNGSLQGNLTRKLAASSGGSLVAVNSRFSAGKQSLVRLFLGSVVDRPR